MLGPYYRLYLDIVLCCSLHNVSQTREHYSCVTTHPSSPIATHRPAQTQSRSALLLASRRQAYLCGRNLRFPCPFQSINGGKVRVIRHLSLYTDEESRAL